MYFPQVGRMGYPLGAEQRATPLVHDGASNHGSWRKNVVNSYNRVQLSAIIMQPNITQYWIQQYSDQVKT